MKRLVPHLHLRLTFCHKYAVCQISYTGEGKKAPTNPSMFIAWGYSTQSTLLSYSRQSVSAGAKLHKWFELKDSEGGYKRYL